MAVNNVILSVVAKPELHLPQSEALEDADMVAVAS